MGESHRVPPRAAGPSPAPSHTVGTSGLTSISDALAAIGRRIRPLEVVPLPLDQADGLTLAESIATDIDSPPFDKAMMDGFAVRSADCTGATSTLQVVAEVAAGQSHSTMLQSGQAVRINTGAPMPPGADAVVIIERADLSAEGRQMTTSERPGPGMHVSPRGSDAAAGQVVLEAGTRLGAAQIAAAAAAGGAQVRVYRRPRAAILVTGDELVPASQKPAGAQIRNSNGPCLTALARKAGCEVVDLGVARDEPAILSGKIATGLRADLLCLSGGVSMGQHDHVPQILREAGVHIEVQKIAIRPGKPMLFGIGPAGQVVFGLPGNPASAFVCFVVFVRAALAAMQGRPVGWPPMLRARLLDPLKPTGGRAEWLPARAGVDEQGQWQVAPARWTGSGDVFGLGRSNALIYRDAASPGLQTGDVVRLTLVDMMI